MQLIENDCCLNYFLWELHTKVFAKFHICLLIIILVLFFSFYFWLNNSFSHMKRLRLVDYFVWLFVLFCFLSWICRVIIHNFITFLPFPKGLRFSSFIPILTYFTFYLEFYIAFYQPFYYGFILTDSLAVTSEQNVFVPP